MGLSGKSVPIYQISRYNNYCCISAKMYFEDLSDKATCPYNKNHVFDKEKLIFHINRCKDGMQNK